MNALQRIRDVLKKDERERNYTCDICGREVFENERVCGQCYAHLPWNRDPVCPLCGRSVKEEGVCLECKQEPLRTDKARSVFLHEEEAARLVVRYKRGQKYLVYALAELLLPLYRREFSEADALVFVPMTRKAEKARGYNQSRLLAEELGLRAGVPVLDVSVKQKETSAQKMLGRKDRQKNLERCFHIFDRTAVKGKKLVILDDTLTTGATVSELADALKRAGAREVYAITVTSVRNKNPFGIPPSSSAPRSTE